MKSLQAFLGEYFGAVILLNVALAAVSLALRKHPVARFTWAPAILLNGGFGVSAIALALPGFAARGPDAIGQAFLFIPVGFGLLSLCAVVALAWFRPQLSFLSVSISILPLASLFVIAPRIDSALERTAVIEVLDASSAPIPVTARPFFEGEAQVAVEGGRILVRFAYGKSYVSIVVRRSDGLEANIGLSHVGHPTKQKTNAYSLSESGVTDRTIVEEASVMSFQIKPIKWHKERRPTRR